MWKNARRSLRYFLRSQLNSLGRIGSLNGLFPAIRRPDRLPTPSAPRRREPTSGLVEAEPLGDFAVEAEARLLHRKRVAGARYDDELLVGVGQLGKEPGEIRLGDRGQPIEVTEDDHRRRGDLLWIRQRHLRVEVEEDAVWRLRTPLRDLLDPRLHRDRVGSRGLEQTTRIVRRDRPELLGRRLANWRAPHGRRVQNESLHLLRMLHGEEACHVGAPRPTEQIDFVHAAELADVINGGVDVVGGDLRGDAEPAGVVIGAAVVLVVDGEDVEPLADEVIHERVGHGRLLRDLEIERDTPRRSGAVRKQYDLTRLGEG